MKAKPGKVIKQFMLGEHDIIFRYLMESDLEPALEYINSMIKEKAYIAVQKKQTLEQEKKWLSDNLNRMKKGDGVTIVLEVDGKYSGTSSVTRKPLDANRHVCIIGIGISRDHRSKGIGKELMKTLCYQAKDVLKCKIMELSVYSMNEIAKKLYEKSGFRETGIIPKGCNHYGKYYDEIIMVKEL